MTEEKRFIKDHSYLVSYDKYCILDKMRHKYLYLDEVIDLLNEQQDTITEQDEKIKEVKTENEQLQRELDCFHPVMFQDMRKGTVVLYLKELK